LNLVSVKPDRLARFGAELWWMSPPCQPVTIRGARKDVEERRCESFLHLLNVLETTPPNRVVVENVPGFEGSIAHARLRHALRHFVLTEVEWCPTMLGLPVQRRRFYLVATPDPVALPIFEQPRRALADFVEPDPPAHTTLDPVFWDRFGGALQIVDADDEQSVACCFTGAYGKSPVYAGSYLRQNGVVRRFSPTEIARLHGFPSDFVLPDDPRRAYKLLGNSLTVDLVREVLTLASA
jgi:DNA (cytosine-5)-methyltransferase 1/tRNA (cytosine38-C5)-methyltransferase